ncbi:MAG: transcription termination/antitermination protein NusA [Candidatus Kerfeldbacteria bacterium]|nr:transcription termination/antitermination protein NusA [Candidatus Kerfeldbacteria bacterium]
MKSQAQEILEAAKIICEEKHISLDSVIETIEAALAVAYRKDFGEKNQNIKVTFNMEDGSARVFDVKTVVTDEKKELTEKLLAERQAAAEAAAAESSDAVTPVAPVTPVTEEATEEFERFNPKTEITLTEAQAITSGAALGDEIKTELFPPAAYGRMAAQTAKQVIIQRLREAERDMIFREYKDKEGEVINGTVQRVEGRVVLIDLGQATAIVPPAEQVPHERYTPGQRLKFYVVSVSTTPKGPEILLSRAHPELVRKLFSLEVPEIGNGSVEIKSIAREAGSRTKIAVWTDQKNIDPVGSCVGQRGSRVQTIISEIGGEKIDIIEWDDDAVKFISNALSPAKVLSVQTNLEEKTAKAEVKEDQLSLAIGKSGQNVRLSAKLTGWKIDIVSESGERPKRPEAAEGTADASAESVADAPAAAPEAVTEAEAAASEAVPAEPETPADEPKE